MNSLGVLSPNQTVGRYRWSDSLKSTVSLIAVYRAYFITTVQGDIYYRESRDLLEWSRVTSLIRKHKNDRFIPTYLWIITWNDVPEYSLSFTNNMSIEERITFPI